MSDDQKPLEPALVELPDGMLKLFIPYYLSAVAPSAEAPVPTWEALEAAALHDAVLHRAISRVAYGDATREQALIEAVLTLAKINAALHAAEVDRLMREPARTPPPTT